MKVYRLLFAIAGPLFLHLCAVAATVHYVDANGTNPVSPYASWATAATNIQDAANHAFFGDTILVTNGIYQYGGDSFNGSNRVDDVNSAAIQSVNGPAVTIIKGYQVPGSTNGIGAARCVYLREFGTLSGFTLVNGATAGAGDGGGVYAETSCGVSNCVIIGNAAASKGGGSYCGSVSGTVVNCVIAGNFANSAPTSSSGGGAYGSVLDHCIVTNNFAIHGGGLAFGTANNCLFAGNGSTNNSTGTDGGAAYASTLNNCTLVGNFSRAFGTAEACTLNNCIIYYNSNSNSPDCYQCLLTNSCTDVGPGSSLLPNNSISNAPAFVDLTHGDYHLQIGSPGMNGGTNVFAPGTTDLDGNPRIVGGTVDMGAYENQNTNPVHYVSVSNTVPVSPYTNWLTAATNIQDAVAVALAHDFVVVSTGFYKFGGAIVYGSESNRVALTNPVTVLGLYGASSTVIIGSVLGSATRCVYVGSNAVLNGFTLADGTTTTSGDNIKEQSGGGAWCEPGGVISNCYIGGNNFPYVNGSMPFDTCTAQWEGSAVYGGTICNSTLANNIVMVQGGAAAAATLVNCVITSNNCQFGYAAGIYQGTASNCTISANVNLNSVFQRAGGAYQCTFYNCTFTGNRGYTGGTSTCTNYNCTFTGNSGSQGGGAYGSILNNCLLTGNTASSLGGGAYFSTLNNCVVSNNLAQAGGGVSLGTANNCLISSNATGLTAGDGGGAFSAVLNNCVLRNNVASSLGGGACNCTLANCTVAGNNGTSGLGGGLYAGTATNCIVYHNLGLNFSNYTSTVFRNSDTTPLPDGFGNITNEPAFVDLANDDLHLQSNSPCINSGYNAAVATNIDLDGNPRIAGGTVDMGAYEFQSPSSILSYAWLQEYGLPTDGSADHADTDGDGMNNYAEWITGTNPTNALSYLQMTSAQPINNFSNATITWQSVTGVNYFVQRGSDLSAQPPFSTIATNLAGQAGTTSYTDTNAVGTGPFFYRVGVSQ